MDRKDIVLTGKAGLRVGLFVLLGSLLFSCHRHPQKLEPKINYVVQDRYLKQLTSPFPSLSQEERDQEWGKEYQIGLAFARQLDLYQAVTAFRRGLILLPADAPSRKLEMQYEILLSYYFGKKYADLAYAFETNDLRFVDSSFPAFHDLLVILYDSYIQLHEEAKAAKVLQMMQQNDPSTQEKLAISTTLMQGNIPLVKKISEEYPAAGYLKEFLNTYNTRKKSSTAAQLLNASLPGAGYLYLGQNQSATTAFLLNGLFIAASYHFFHRGHIAAGIIFTSFELGWYFGGIYGAAEEAKLYNERVYEKEATPLMNERGLFPILTLKYAF
ncbi:MAG: tetratricopeptide repeat protein [Anaerolineae bacterium]